MIIASFDMKYISPLVPLDSPLKMLQIHTKVHILLIRTEGAMLNLLQLCKMSVWNITNPN
jgi:hypothetical protein